MMTDIYKILSKHFLGEASEEEEKRAAAFREAHPDEYTMLHRFWSKRIGRVKEFDAGRGWQLLQEALATRDQPAIPLYRRLQRVAAAVILILSLSVAGYYGYRHYSTVTYTQQMPEHRNEPVLLDDGTKIWLNTGARISYPKSFGKKERHVRLEGEAYFEVAHDAEHPFTVAFDHGTVTVLGTSFNIFSGGDSSKVTVVTGRVRVTGASRSSSVVITPGYEAVVRGDRVTKAPAGDPNYLAWKTGEFIFRETPLREAIRQLNRYYNGRFVVQEEDLARGCHLTAHFKRSRPEDVASVIELSCDIKVTLTGENIKR